MKEKQTIVIKIGTSSLSYNNGNLNEEVIANICNYTTALQQSNYNVVIVSSGAIGAGMNQLNLEYKPTKLSMKQAAAAVGQAILIQTYQKYYEKHNQKCAQILVTNDLIKCDKKRDNVVQTIRTLHELKVIPIVNENDSVSTAEIQSNLFSDNDTLSAIVSNLVNAKLLILLSDVDGLYEKENGALTSKVIPYVEKISEQITRHISMESSTLGRGGMTSKLRAIDTATKNGIDVILTNISTIERLNDMIVQKDIGTYFKGGN